MVNDFENRDDIDQISDLIEVDIPFKNGVLANTQHPFVVFDTPGSNSASNAKHLKVLKEAIRQTIQLLNRLATQSQIQ